MISHQMLKRDKFLSNCGCFALVSFSANKQSNFLAFKELLYINKLEVKFVKSKSIKKCLENYIKFDLLISLRTVSFCPLFIIKPKTGTNFINTFFNFSQKFFVDSKTSLLSCFYQGKNFFSNNLFLLKKETPEKFLKSTYSFYVNTFLFLNLTNTLLLKVLKLKI